MLRWAPAVLALGVMFPPAPRIAPEPTGPACTTAPAPAGPDAGIHGAFDGLLRAFVRNGRVSYACFQAHEAKLDAYLATLDATDPASLPEAEAIALWINAYNAYTIKLILTRYPRLESIRDIPRRWSRRDWRVGGRSLSLDDIEHRILRREFVEPRIHFAIVCASVSCPALAAEAYVGGRLDRQLDRAAREFLADTARGARLDQAGAARPHLYVSAIFKWFRKDFERAGSVVEFVARYLPPAERAALGQARDVQLRHLDYDWKLNDAAADAGGSRQSP